MWCVDKLSQEFMKFLSSKHEGQVNSSLEVGDKPKAKVNQSKCGTALLAGVEKLRPSNIGRRQH